MKTIQMLVIVGLFPYFKIQEEEIASKNKDSSSAMNVVNCDTLCRVAIFLTKSSDLDDSSSNKSSDPIEENLTLMAASVS